MKRFRSVSGILLFSLVWASAAATAQSQVADFYRGRTLTLVIAHEAGTGYDLYGRLLARHIGRHIPGEPQVVPQNMLGGGGLHGANWLYNVAPADGATIATFAHSAILEPLLGSSGIRLDSTRLQWIGNMDETVSTCVVAARTGVTSLDQLLARETIYGGAGGPLTVFGAAVIRLLGAKGRLIGGYKSSADIKLAMIRGELDATCGMSRSTLQTQWRDELASGLIRPVAQFGRQPHPAFPGVTHAYTFARTDADRQVFDLIFGASSLGRPVAAPPSAPADRVAALRSAFDASMRDAKLLADAERSRLDISAMTGTQVQELVTRFFASPRDVVDRAKQASLPP